MTAINTSGEPYYNYMFFSLALAAMLHPSNGASLLANSSAETEVSCTGSSPISSILMVKARTICSLA